MPHAQGIRHAKAVAPFETVELARELHEGGMKPKQIAKTLGYPLDTVNDWIYYRTRCYE